MEKAFIVMLSEEQRKIEAWEKEKNEEIDRKDLDVWVAVKGEGEKGDYISEYHVPDAFEYIQEDDYSEEEAVMSLVPVVGPLNLGG